MQPCGDVQDAFLMESQQFLRPLEALFADIFPHCHARFFFKLVAEIRFLFATMLYYIKWAYCADLTTGVVNDDRYAILSLVGSMMMFLPLIVGTIIATPLMKGANQAFCLSQFISPYAMAMIFAITLNGPYIMSI